MVFNATFNNIILVKLKSSLRTLYGRRHDLGDCYGISVSQMTDMFHLSQTLPGSFLIHDISWFVTRLLRRVPLVEKELPTLPEHLSSPPIFSWVRVTRSLVLCVCFVDCCLSFYTFSFGHCVVCSSSIYESYYPFGIFKLFLSFLLSIVLSVLL
jgi:hypothetical protein